MLLCQGHAQIPPTRFQHSANLSKRSSQCLWEHPRYHCSWWRPECPCQAPHRNDHPRRTSREGPSSKTASLVVARDFVRSFDEWRLRRCLHWPASGSQHRRDLHLIANFRTQRQERGASDGSICAGLRTDRCTRHTTRKCLPCHDAWRTGPSTVCCGTRRAIGVANSTFLKQLHHLSSSSPQKTTPVRAFLVSYSRSLEVVEGSSFLDRSRMSDVQLKEVDNRKARRRLRRDRDAKALTPFLPWQQQLWVSSPDQTEKPRSSLREAFRRSSLQKSSLALSRPDFCSEVFFVFYILRNFMHLSFIQPPIKTTRFSSLSIWQ